MGGQEEEDVLEWQTAKGSAPPMTERLYLDPGVLVALLEERDDLSIQAREVMMSGGWKVTSSLAVSELVGLLSLRRARTL